MLINRHNYEDYFILYLDNELDAAGNKEVEDFLAANPDLQSELDGFRQVILAPDENLVFEEKDNLLITGSAVNVYNYQELLLTCMDNELPLHQKEALEQYVMANPAAAAEREMLQRTRLYADESIVFPGKENLYRNSEVYEIKPAAWWRVAAAAVIILGMGAGGFLVYSDQQENSNTGIARQVVPASQHTPGIVNRHAAGEVTMPAKIETLPAIDKNSPAHQQDANDKHVSNPATGKQDANPSSNQGSLQKPIGIPVRVLDIAPGSEIAHTELQQQNINDVAVTNEINTTYYPKASNDINQPIYAADLEQDNKKIRGFFRKATRIIERTTNISATNEDDKLLLGAFAIDLK